MSIPGPPPFFSWAPWLKVVGVNLIWPAPGWPMAPRRHITEGPVQQWMAGPTRAAMVGTSLTETRKLSAKARAAALELQRAERRHALGVLRPLAWAVPAAETHRAECSAAFSTSDWEAEEDTAPLSAAPGRAGGTLSRPERGLGLGNGACTRPGLPCVHRHARLAGRVGRAVTILQGS